jgi:hypothetical protein
MLIGVVIWGLFVMPIVSKIAGSPLDVFIELIFMIVLLYAVLNILKIGKRDKKS